MAVGERKAKSAAKTPLVVEVEQDNSKKDMEALDIEIPVLSPRVYREYKNLSDLERRPRMAAALAPSSVSGKTSVPPAIPVSLPMETSRGASSARRCTTSVGTDNKNNAASAAALPAAMSRFVLRRAATPVGSCIIYFAGWRS
ncbi:MAG: hypothetical protein EXQ56_02165 [Acidobacteria bacterium]|nr:hypothetical protein [Acidobacteriota bacterium]